MGLQIDGGPIKAWLEDGPDDRAVPLLDWLEEKAEEHYGNRFLAHKQRSWPNGAGRTTNSESRSSSTTTESE